MPTTLRTLATPALIIVVTAAIAGGASAKGTGSIAGSVNASQAKLKKHALVYLERVDGTYPPPTTPVHMDQKNQEFIPFVLPVVKGTEVTFLNSDATGHNIFTPDGEKFDMGVFNKDETRKYTFAKEGVYTLLCKMHPSMIAYVVVLQNPFHAVTDEAGHFTIANVPAGKYRLKVWHERRKAEPVDVVVEEGKPAAVAIELHK